MTESKHIISPLAVKPPYQGAAQNRIDIPVSQHHEIGTQCGYDFPLQAIGEVGRIEQGVGPGAKYVPFLGQPQTFSGKFGVLQAADGDSIPLGLKPFAQQRHLGRAPYAIGSFQDDQSTSKAFFVHIGKPYPWNLAFVMLVLPHPPVAART